MFKIVQIFVLTLEVKTGTYKNQNRSTLIKRRYYSMNTIFNFKIATFFQYLFLISDVKTGNMQTNKNV